MVEGCSPRYNRTMVRRCAARAVIALLLTSGLISMTPTAVPLGAQEDRPELGLRARPNLAFAPAEIVFTGRLRGGADDNEEFYCVSAEWDWDDETRSERIYDCEPYEPGVSEIRRRFSRRHTFDYGGRYEVRLTLKRGDEIIESARTAIQVQGP